MKKALLTLASSAMLLQAAMTPVSASQKATAAVVGAGAGAAVSSVINTDLLLSTGVGALLAYLIATQVADKPLEQYFADSGIDIIDDAAGTHLVISTDTLFKKPNGDIIDANYYNVLNQVARLVKDYPHVAVAISGHTDNIPTEKQRLEYSDKAAKSIADYLMARGVSGHQIVSVRGKGDAKPMRSNQSLFGRRANRRIEVAFLLPQPQPPAVDIDSLLYPDEQPTNKRELRLPEPLQ